MYIAKKIVCIYVEKYQRSFYFMVTRVVIRINLGISGHKGGRKIKCAYSKTFMATRVVVGQKWP